MKTYQELKEQHREELNAFDGIFFAFSEKQFDEGLAQLGIAKEDAKAKLSKLPGGGFILKDRVRDFLAMFDRHEEDRKALFRDHAALADALIYELRNHEYCYTGDPSDALRALGLSAEEVPASIMRKATNAALPEEV